MQQIYQFPSNPIEESLRQINISVTQVLKSAEHEGAVFAVAEAAWVRVATEAERRTSVRTLASYVFLAIASGLGAVVLESFVRGDFSQAFGFLGPTVASAIGFVAFLRRWAGRG